MQTPWARREDAAKTQWRLHRLREVSVQTPPPPAAIMCVLTARTRRPRGALGDLTASLLRRYCDPTAFLRRAFRSQWERRATARTLCMLKVRAVAWRPRRPHGVQWRCHGDATAMPRRSRRSHCAHLGVLKFSWTPCNRREDAALVWQGL